jgi:hypothetical protein
MLNTAKQIDLPWLFSFLEDPLRLMSQLDREDGVCLSGADTKGAFDVPQFFFSDE